MSAWYVLSSLGFYQAEPAGGRYYFGSPLFDRADLKVGGGIFSVSSHCTRDGARSISPVRLNRDPYPNPDKDFKDM